MMGGGGPWGVGWGGAWAVQSYLIFTFLQKKKHSIPFTPPIFFNPGAGASPEDVPVTMTIRLFNQCQFATPARRPLLRALLWGSVCG